MVRPCGPVLVIESFPVRSFTGAPSPALECRVTNWRGQRLRRTGEGRRYDAEEGFSQGNRGTGIESPEERATREGARPAISLTRNWRSFVLHRRGRGFSQGIWPRSDRLSSAPYSNRFRGALFLTCQAGDTLFRQFRVTPECAFPRLSLHRTDLAARIAGETAEDLRVELPNLLCRALQFVDAEDGPRGRIEGDLGQVHARFNDRLAGQADLDAIVVRQAIDGVRKEINGYKKEIEEMKKEIDGYDFLLLPTEEEEDTN